MTERMERAAEAAARRVEAAQEAASRRVDAVQDAASRRVEAAQGAAPRGAGAVQEAASRSLEAAQRGVEVAQEAAAEVVAKVKPRLRGVIHEYSFFVAIVLGALLVWQANGGRETLATAIYAAGICGLFGVSALYHRVTWRPRARAWMRRLDHSMIFVFIAASFTPFALLVLHGTLATTIFAVDLGRRAGGRRAVARLDRRAEVGQRARLRRARHGRDHRGAGHLERARLAAGRGRRARRRALHRGRGHLRDRAARTPSPRSSATTRSSTRWSPAPRRCTTP